MCVYMYICIYIAPIYVYIQHLSMYIYSTYLHGPCTYAHNLLVFWIWIDYDFFFHSLISSSSLIWGENRRFPRCFLCLLNESVDINCWLIYCALYLTSPHHTFKFYYTRGESFRKEKHHRSILTVPLQHQASTHIVLI